jgi:hypothetical protein
MTQEEVFENAWECTIASLYNLSYESADEGSLSADEIIQLTDRMRDIARWVQSQKERCRQHILLAE